jgi:hypothetical protein
MDQTCFGRSGGFAPTILRLLHGTYHVPGVLKTSIMAISLLDEVDYYRPPSSRAESTYETRLYASIAADGTTRDYLTFVRDRHCGSLSRCQRDRECGNG